MRIGQNKNLLIFLKHMPEYNKPDLTEMSGAEEEELKTLRAEFPAGRNVKVPRSDGLISEGKVIAVEKKKRGIRVVVVIEENGGAILKPVRPEELREANLKQK